MGASHSTQRPSMSTYPGARANMQRNPNFNAGSRVSSGPSSRNTIPSRSRTPSVGTISQPGAYAISRNSRGSSSVFRVNVPENIRSGQEFQVYAGSRIVRVRCPANARPGMAVQITVPPEDTVENISQTVAVLTSAEGDGGGGAVRMNSTARILNENVDDGNHDEDVGLSSTNNPPAEPPRTYQVRIPPGVIPGTNFPVLVNGQQIQVQCPFDARPGTLVRINPPAHLFNHDPNIQSATDLNRAPDSSSGPNHASGSKQSGVQMVDQTFEVKVPKGVRPGQPFTLMAAGQRVLVKCPLDAKPGSRIRFNLPVPVSTKTNTEVTMEYATKDGWTRSIRVTDMKFTWIRLNTDGDLKKEEVSFNVDTSAFVRKIVFMEGNDKRMRTGKVVLVPASEYCVDSAIVKNPEVKNSKELVGYGKIAQVQKQSMDDKVAWMLGTCNDLSIPWEEGHMRICVRRQHLLIDSIQAVMSLGRQDLRKIWRFEFMGELGIDAGGLAKEWFLLVTQAIFDADSGLWLSSEGNQMLMRINPASEATCPEDHLIYFRFLGRVLGKALCAGQIVSGHMVQYLYKYLLGWPITFADLESVDESLHQNLRKLLGLNLEEVEYMCLDFTATLNLLGESVQTELVPNGGDRAVTGDNLTEYLEAYFKYIMLERIKPQVTELLLGFYDVVPEPLLTVFDYQELELIMCGLPTIDMKDWMKNTIYKGTYSTLKERSIPCKWFWEIVQDEFDQEMRARLLQFVTGTSGVPSRGFSVLQGSDGNIKLFCLNGVKLDGNAYPRSHTCFNRLDLPTYKSKSDLRNRLKYAVTNCSTGFTIE